MLDYLAAFGYDPRYGARFLQRAIREKLIIPLAYTLNQYEYDDQIMLRVSLEDGEIILQATADPLAFDLLMEQWDKLTLAEQASILRRKMMMMQEGPSFMRMQSELDMMESDKLIDERAFWDNLDRSNLYTKLLNVKSKTTTMYERIKKYEVEIALAAMEQGTFKTDFETRLEKWESGYQELLVKIYSLLYPEYNSCFLSIYGNQLAPVLQFYINLIEENAFDLKNMQAVWYREGFNGIDDDNPFLNDRNKMPSPYIKRNISLNQPHQDLETPSQPTDRLYGVELMITGPAVALYLKRESGIQQWETEVKDQPNLYHIGADHRFSPTPPNIYRQQFYQKPKPRRLVSMTGMQDLQMNIQVQAKRGDLPSQYNQSLQEIFLREIEQFFY